MAGYRGREKPIRLLSLIDTVDKVVIVVNRSLVALSLILSLLLFNPAPLYILDEVDAALDLSHTQNIGQMLKTHFRHSQVQKTGFA
jgi:ABC-type iron transport system FetAB ATPase subunit